MNTLIAPGMWIVPVEPLPELAATIAVYVDNKPHFCTELDLIDRLPARVWGRCMVCGNKDLYLRVREHPGYCFCPTHWRPVLSPKADLFDKLLAPIPRKEQADGVS